MVCYELPRAYFDSISGNLFNNYYDKNEADLVVMTYYYSKPEIDQNINAVYIYIISGRFLDIYYQKPYIDATFVKGVDFNFALEQFYTKLAINSSFTYYYTKLQTNSLFYTKTEVDSLFINNDRWRWASPSGYDVLAF